jgi:hypothetical protein
MNHNQTTNNCGPTHDTGHYEPIDAGNNALLTMIAQTYGFMTLLNGPHLQSYPEKARRLQIILVHETLKLAATPALSSADARLKAAFLRDQLDAVSLSLSPSAQTIIEAALAFEAELFRNEPSRH